jgi:phospholipid-binding lipoprotein MlaA
LDKYSFTRDAYLQRRQSLVFDGNPPRDNGADIDFGPTVTEQFKPGSDSAPVVVFPATEQAPVAVTGEFDLTDRTTVAASPALPSSR